MIQTKRLSSGIASHGSSLLSMRTHKTATLLSMSRRARARVCLCVRVLESFVLCACVGVCVRVLCLRTLWLRIKISSNFQRTYESGAREQRRRCRRHWSRYGDSIGSSVDDGLTIVDDGLTDMDIDWKKTCSTHLSCTCFVLIYVLYLASYVVLSLSSYVVFSLGICLTCLCLSLSPHFYQLR